MFLSTFYYDNKINEISHDFIPTTRSFFHFPLFSFFFFFSFYIP